MITGPGGSSSSLLRRACRLALVLPFILRSAAPVFAEDNPDSLSIVILPFSGDDISSQWGPIAQTLPLRLRESLSPVKYRLLDESSLLGWRLRQAAIRNFRTAEQIEAKLAENDALEIKGVNPVKASDTRYVNAKSIRDLEKAMTDTASLEAARNDGVQGGQIPVPLAWKDPMDMQSAGGNRATAGATRDFPVFCAQNSVDLVVFGSMESSGDYLGVSVGLYDALDGRVAFSTSNAFAYDDASPVVDILAEELGKAIGNSGRTAISIEADPPDSSIYLDGEFAAKGKLEAPYIAPGAHHFRVEAEGFMPHEFQFTSSAGDSRSWKLSLKKLDVGVRAVSTSPDGAFVYSRSVYRGNASLAADFASDERVVYVGMEGYTGEYAFLGKEGVSLKLDKESGKERLKKRKDAFYWSLGAFVITIPPSILSYNTFLDWDKMTAKRTASDADLANRETWRIASLSSIGATAAFFVNACIQIFPLIQAIQ